MDLYRNLVNGPPGSEELLLSTSQPKFPMDWSADGRFLLYDSLDPKRGFDMWALPLEGDRKEPFAGRPDGLRRRSRPVFSRRNLDCLPVGQDGAP